jgi:GntR family transcriptional regulator
MVRIVKGGRMDLEQRFRGVDKNSDVPIYVQLKDALKSDILEKRIKPNEKIPSETVLARDCCISRMTVRHTIRELQKEGWIFTKHGKGSFASSQNNTQMLIKLDGFSTEMIKLGFKVNSKILEVKKTGFNNDSMDAYSGLQEEKKNALVIIRRVRFVEGQPFAIESSFLPLHIGKDLLVRGFDEHFSIYRFLEEELTIRLSRADHVIEPKLITQRDAKLLGIKSGMPVLFISGTTFSKSNEPIEFIKGIYLADRYKLKVNIRK